VTRRGLAFAVGGVALYAVAVGSLAVRDPLWNDELYTWYFARLPTFGDVWRELSTGVEQLPPFYYMTERTSLWLLGDNDLALRLPSMLGMLLAGVCLFIVVARRTNGWYGVVAVLIPAASGAFRYAWEARPYALVLGFAAAALLAHQSRADGIRPRFAAVALACALAAATGLHYYGVLIVLPIAAAELVRWWGRRVVDAAVLAALAVPLVPLAVASPLIADARKYSGSFWTEFDLSTAPQFYAIVLRAQVFGPSRIPDWLAIGFVSLVVAGSVVVLFRRPRKAQSEVAASVVFAALPLVGVVLGELVTGAYVDRYVIAAVLGPAVLVPLALHRLAAGRRGPAVVATALVAAWFLVLFQYWHREISVDNDRRAGIVSFLEAEAPPGLLVAVDHHHDYLELASHAPPAVAARLARLSDGERALRFTDNRSTEDGLVVLSRFAPLRIVPYEDRPAQFLVLETVRGSSRDWLLRALRDDHARLDVVARDDDGFTLMRVRPAPQP
jgi:hypothetical protein